MVTGLVTVRGPAPEPSGGYRVTLTLPVHVHMYSTSSKSCHQSHARAHLLRFAAT